MLSARLFRMFARVGAAACVAIASAAHADVSVGDHVALPEVRLLDGRTLPEGHFKGKPLIIHYWASWCPYCGRQNPRIEKLWKEARNQGLEILTVSIDANEADAVNYLRDHDYSFPVAMETSALREALGKRRIIPHVFVIRADGQVVEAIPGEMVEKDVLGLIKHAPERKP